MTLFMWKKSYELNIPEIDVQHRRLVGMINELADAMLMKQGQRAIPHVLDELVAYVQIHFAAEEKVMRRMQFPGLSDHASAHRDLTEKVLAFRDRYSRDQSLDPRELLDFLCDWLKSHIIVCDKEIATHARRIKMGLGE